MNAAPEPASRTLLVAGLRGFCAGVVRAIDVVKQALDVCDGPLYVRKEIIHNRFVVDELREKGAIFVEEIDEVPDGSWLIYSAHGVAPAVREDARRKKLRTIDATCPLVTKVHIEAIHYARLGYTIILIGHEEHDETVGTLGEAPDAIRLVGTREEAEAVVVPDPERVAYLTQTTLSLDDTREIVGVLQRRFPKMVSPAKGDICYATQNRQDAVRAMAPHVEMLLVLGAPNSSNSLRLCEVGLAQGVPSHLIERASDIDPAWLDGVRILGLTASASAPEVLVQEVVAHAREMYGVTEVREFETVREDVTFSLPPELKTLLPTRPGTSSSSSSSSAPSAGSPDIGESAAPGTDSGPETDPAGTREKGAAGAGVDDGSREPSTPESASFSRRAKPFLIAGGLALVAAVFGRIGWREIAAHVATVGPWFAFLVAIYAVSQAAFVQGWRSVFDSPPPIRQFPRLYGLYLSGYAANSIAPGNVAGEPLKMHMLRGETGGEGAVASVTLHKHADLLSQWIFIAVGVVVALASFPLPRAARIAAVGATAGLGLLLILMTWALARGAYSPILRRLSAFRPLARRLETLRGAAGNVDVRIARFYAEHPGRFAASTAWCFAGWCGGLLETWILLRLLVPGAGWPAAIAVECLAMTLNNLFLFIPGRVGSAEGVRVGVFLLLGLPAAPGAAYGLLRRAREIAWTLPGLVLLSRPRWISRPGRGPALGPLVSGGGRP
ncbi:MAG: 4-hydroxy-3-methylbut-2-enyl diphosphate reductase [Acidobacteriota bacterium]